MAKFCTSCGAELEESAGFCTNCGQKVEDDTEGIGGTGLPLEQADQIETPQASSQPVVAVSESAVTAPNTAGMTMAVTEATPVAPAPVPTSTSAPSATSTPAPQTPTTFAMGSTMSQPTMYQAQVGQTGVPYTGQQQSGSNNKTWIIVGVAAAIVIVVAIALIAFVLLGNGGNKSNESTSAGGGVTASTSSSATAGNRTIHFDSGGGSSVPDSQIASGGQLSAPDEPTKSGYTFDGWYKDASFTTKVNFPLTVDEDLTLYAKWSQNSPTTNSSPSGSSTKTLTVVGADGTTRSDTIHRSGSSERVFPDSNSRRLSESEVRSLNDAERCVAWNEIIAASNGYQFKNSGLREYFNSCSWYHANPGAAAGGTLSPEASANVDLLKKYTDNWWQSLAAY